MQSLQTFISLAGFAFALHFGFLLILYRNEQTAWKKAVKPWKWVVFSLMAWVLGLIADGIKGAQTAAKKRR